jgi:hypothetical protein
MNSSAKRSLLIGIGIVTVVVLLFFYFRSQSPKYRWYENYQYNNNQPYGLKLIFDLLSKSRSKKDIVLINRPIKESLDKSDTSALYVFIGANFMADSIGSESLINFVARGNNAFISSKSSSHCIFSTVTKGQYPFITYEYVSDSTINVFFNDGQKDSVFKFNYKYRKMLMLNRWFGIPRSFFSDTLSGYGFEGITHIDYWLTDCFRVKWGKGWFIFHFNPVFFTNYNMAKSEGLNYINRLLSDYNKQKIYWDEFSKTPVRGMGEDTTQESPLRFILSERSLRWSWYLIIIFILIFILFNSKRRQARMPLMPVNRNTTVEYINAIAAHHHSNNSNAFLADEILKLFLSFISHRYGISSKMDRKEMIKILAKRSYVPEETIKILFIRHAEARYNPVPEAKDLIDFYKLTEYFYQNCK